MYCIFVLVCIVVYFVILLSFEANYPNIVDSKKEHEIENFMDEEHLLKDTKESISDIKIIIQSFDI